MNTCLFASIEFVKESLGKEKLLLLDVLLNVLTFISCT